MDRTELLTIAAFIHTAAIHRQGDATPRISVREAARLIREVNKRMDIDGNRERADYYDGIVPKEPPQATAGSGKHPNNPNNLHPSNWCGGNATNCNGCPACLPPTGR